MAKCKGKNSKGTPCKLNTLDDSGFCGFHSKQKEVDCGEHCGPTEPIENDIPDFEAEGYSCTEIVNYVLNVTGRRVQLNAGDGFDRLVSQANEALA